MLAHAQLLRYFPVLETLGHQFDNMQLTRARPTVVLEELVAVSDERMNSSSARTEEISNSDSSAKTVPHLFVRRVQIFSSSYFSHDRRRTIYGVLHSGVGRGRGFPARLLGFITLSHKTP
jgi:hypothetical protein